jgi:hypothetical protein
MLLLDAVGDRSFVENAVAVVDGATSHIVWFYSPSRLGICSRP